MIQLVFIFFAAMCKAISDTLADHFDISIFRSKNRRFWDKNISWQYAKKIGGYKIDAWHISNSIMVCCFLAAIHFPNLIVQNQIVNFVVLGVTFNVSFTIFYDYVLKKK